MVQQDVHSPDAHASAPPAQETSRVSDSRLSLMEFFIVGNHRITSTRVECETAGHAG